MANLATKNGVYLARFRYAGAQHKRSLKTRNADAAELLLLGIKTTLHQLKLGLVRVPDGVDAADFIVSGGRLREPVQAAPVVTAPTVSQLIDSYLASETHRVAETYLASQKIHLGHFRKALGGSANQPASRLTRRDVESFFESRRAVRSAETVNRERVTVRKLLAWAVDQKYLASSPADGIAPFKGGSDRPPFRTSAEIEAIIARGGLTDEEMLDVWECLYLAPSEIADLLNTVRQRATADFAHLLHVLPAYTGMRRGEILRLKWIDVDLERGFLTARSRKQSRTQQEVRRQIDLHEELKQELVAWRARRSRGQFVISDQDLQPLDLHTANRHFWQPLRGTQWCLNAKRNRFKIGFHSYRHSFASNLAAAGVDQRVIDEFMGHQTEAMRQRYRHLHPSRLRAAIDAFSLVAASTRLGG